MAGRKREWLRKKMMGRKEQRQWAVNGKGGSLSLAWRRWRQNRRSRSSEPFIQRVIYRCVFYLMYAAEAVILIASFCYFYLRFGFRL